MPGGHGVNALGIERAANVDRDGSRVGTGRDLKQEGRPKAGRLDPLETAKRHDMPVTPLRLQNGRVGTTRKVELHRFGLAADKQALTGSGIEADCQVRVVSNCLPNLRITRVSGGTALETDGWMVELLVAQSEENEVALEPLAAGAIRPTALGWADVGCGHDGHLLGDPGLNQGGRRQRWVAGRRDHNVPAVCERAVVRKKTAADDGEHRDHRERQAERAGSQRGTDRLPRQVSKGRAQRRPQAHGTGCRQPFQQSQVRGNEQSNPPHAAHEADAHQAKMEIGVVDP